MLRKIVSVIVELTQTSTATWLNKRSATQVADCDKILYRMRGSLVIKSFTELAALHVLPAVVGATDPQHSKQWRVPSLNSLIRKGR